MFGARKPIGLSIIVMGTLGLCARARAETGAPATAAPASPSNEDCLACHAEQVERAGGGSLPAVGHAFAGSVHGQLDMACTDCHADLQGKDLPHPVKLAAPDCAQCHEEAVKAYDQSVHAGARRLSPTSQAARCIDCHGVHDILSSKDPNSRTYHFNVAATCSKCHANQAVFASSRTPAANIPAQFRDSIHGRALNQSGLLVAPNCATCHGNHAIRRASDEQSEVNRRNIPKTCGSCHEGIRNVYETSVHAAALRAGNPRAAVCSDCHTAHDTQAADQSFKMTLVSECGTCHQESMRTFRDTFHGKVSALGFARAATCADCHDAHGILPKSNPRSTVSDARRVETCRKCHAGATPMFSQYDPHADAHSRAHDPALFYVTRAMKLLLISVFAFFGLHTIMWLGRSLVPVRKARTARTEGKLDGDG